jgi:hypothetical protein
MIKIKCALNLSIIIGLLSLLAAVFLPFDFEIGSRDTALLSKSCFKTHMQWRARTRNFYIECELYWKRSSGRGFEISSSEVRLGNLIIYFGIP